MDSHRAAFVAEAEDGVTDLNNALLALEADPGDAAAMDDVFRVAHTLKGNAAAMGYEDVSSFGHALEDLLDAVRQGDREATPELMDLLFEGVDTVEAMVAEIADSGDVTTDPSELERRLRAMEEHGTAEAEGESADDADSEVETSTDDEIADDEIADDEIADDEIADDGDDTEADTLSVPDLPPAVDDFDSPVVYADVTIGETAMAGVDATLVLQALDSQFDDHVTEPSPEALENGEYDERFDAFVAGADRDVVAEGLEALTQVEAVETVLVGDAAAAETTADDDAEESTSEDTGSGSSSDGRDEIKSIRVDVDQVDELYGLVEQLVTSRIKLRRELEEANAQSDALDELDKLASSLQDTAMDMRLIPFSQVSDSFPRLVRDISRDLDKQIAFDIEGADVELDRTILTEMRDPLVHVLRNAVDHGIESPGEREAAEKDPTGHVQLRAERERDHVIIEVSDDGGGLDPDRLREKAIAEDVKSREAVDAMTDNEVYDLVFHPGFSTAEEVTDVSGRGVGMDVVRTTARDLDGSVSVDSEPGEGTTVRFRLPVTVAIVKVMFVDVGGTEYGIPIKSIAEVARANDIEAVHGDEIVRHEDDLYPVVRLNDRLADSSVAAADSSAAEAEAESTATEPVGAESATTDGGTVDGGMLVRIREETRQVALHCDAVLDQEEVVVKPLDGPLSGTPGLSGTAVLGDGDVVAVLDVVSL
ncbi:chemotaxis protein CheA [Halorubrum sp. DTA46]|uniref:chemotaxis protein CheA n=1 Tax=Halorubrum sp. DTA46 TaxID=3402162 RepID=UPI003AAD5BAE